MVHHWRHTPVLSRWRSLESESLEHCRMWCPLHSHTVANLGSCSSCYNKEQSYNTLTSVNTDNLVTNCYSFVSTCSFPTHNIQHVLFTKVPKAACMALNLGAQQSWELRQRKHEGAMTWNLIDSMSPSDMLHVAMFLLFDGTIMIRVTTRSMWLIDEK